MRKQVLSMCFLSAVFVQTAASADVWFHDHDQGEVADVEIGSLREAHLAFLDARYKDMLLHIKSVLMSESSTEAEKNNALGLLKRTYDEGIQDLPVDWTLPNGVLDIRVGVRRKQYSDDLKYQMGVKMDVVKERQVKQLKVIQYPDKVVFDKMNNVGEFEDELEGNTHKVSVKNEGTKAPQEKGLYLIDITLDSGAGVKGWFILSDEYASASPVILAPALGDHVETGTPTLRWQRFRSPEYKANEARRIGVDVMAVAKNWESVYGYYDSDDGRTEITVGDKIGEGVAKLEPGKYAFGILYGEKHRFGPISLSRESITYSRFEVTK